MLQRQWVGTLVTALAERRSSPVSTAKRTKAVTPRVSPTAPETKSLSASVWRFLENDAPGFNKAMEEGTAQIAAGKATRLSALRPKQGRGRG